MSSKKTSSVKNIIEKEKDEDYEVNDKKEDEEVEDEEVDVNSDDEDEFNYDEDEIDADDEEEEYEEDEDVEDDEVEDEDEVEDDAIQPDIDDEDADDDDDMNIVDDNNDADVESMATRVPDEDRITPNILTKYEMTRVLGIRTKQISEGAKPLISDACGKSPVHIAINELMTQKMPFIIKRSMPYPKYELWKIAELTVELLQDDIDDLINAVK
jgi:DNA-directed RNA polymerase subunit K/omega